MREREKEKKKRETKEIGSAQEENHITVPFLTKLTSRGQTRHPAMSHECFEATKRASGRRFT